MKIIFSVAAIFPLLYLLIASQYIEGEICTTVFLVSHELLKPKTKIYWLFGDTNYPTNETCLGQCSNYTQCRSVAFEVRTPGDQTQCDLYNISLQALIDANKLNETEEPDSQIYDSVYTYDRACECRAGYEMSPRPDPVSCKRCDDGFVKESPGTGKCTKCKDGTVSNEDKTSCDITTPSDLTTGSVTRESVTAESVSTKDISGESTESITNTGAVSTESVTMESVTNGGVTTGSVTEGGVTMSAAITGGVSEGGGEITERSTTTVTRVTRVTTGGGRGGDEEGPGITTTAAVIICVIILLAGIAAAFYFLYWRERAAKKEESHRSVQPTEISASSRAGKTQENSGSAQSPDASLEEGSGSESQQPEPSQIEVDESE